MEYFLIKMNFTQYGKDLNQEVSLFRNLYCLYTYNLTNYQTYFS